MVLAAQCCQCSVAGVMSPIECQRYSVGGVHNVGGVISAIEC